jgi:hypothetical protein
VAKVTKGKTLELRKVAKRTPEARDERFSANQREIEKVSQRYQSAHVTSGILSRCKNSVKHERPTTSQLWLAR